MSQATLTDRPYVNSNLFSGHFLDERVGERDEWDCDDAARAAMETRQESFDEEGELVDRLKATTLPDPDAVADDRRNDPDARARADERDADAARDR